MIQNWKRQIAYKLNVNDIISSKYVKSEGLNPNYLEINAKEVFRLNVIGVVVEKMGHGHHAAIIIDDGTSKISSRSFENSLIFDEINVGDIVLVIGKPREFSSEKYILAEIVKKINPSWMKLRKLELEKRKMPDTTKKPQNEQNENEDNLDLNPTNEVLNLIKLGDKGNGVPIEEVLSKNIKDIDKIVDLLLKDGSIFQVRSGMLKVLE